MNELDAGRQRHVPGAAIATQLSGGEREHRTQPLAACGHDMRRQLRNERHGAVHPRHDRPIAREQVGPDHRRQGAQRIRLRLRPDGKGWQHLRWYGHNAQSELPTRAKP